VEDLRDRVSDMAAEILAILPGMGFKDVMDMLWEELSFWHSKAVGVRKKMLGVQ
jgi:hypothetical protein